MSRKRKEVSERKKESASKALAALKSIAHKYSKTVTNWKYTPEFGLAIADAITEGMTITCLAEHPDLPHRATLYRWVDEIPEFKALIKSARKNRAGYYEDRIWIRSQQITEENAKAVRVEIDAYKFLAKVGDPATYSESQGEKVTPGPTIIMVNTGVPKSEIDQTKTIEIESKPVEE